MFKAVLYLVVMLFQVSAIDVLATEGHEVIVPLFIQGEQHGEIYAVLRPEPNSWTLDAAVFIVAVEPYLNSETLSRLRDEVGTEPMVALSELAAFGVTVEFDPVAVVIRVKLQADVRIVQSYQLGSYNQESPGYADAIAPAFISGALDVLLSNTWEEDEQRRGSAELDGHINLAGWVLESRHGYQEGNTHRWQRRQTQLIHDWPNQQLRLSVGDLSYPFLGLMSNRPISGVSLSTSSKLQPYTSSFPLSQEEFFLEQNSRVDIYVGGSLRDSRVLPAGRHNVLDLPLINGVNEVVLEITDQFGRRQTLNFFDTLDQRLLKPGLSEYAVTLGVPRKLADGGSGIDYESDNPSFSAFYRQGITDDLTFGVHTEKDNEITMVGLSGIASSLWGVIDFDLALSHDAEIGNEDAAGILLGYRYRVRGWSVNAGVSWQDQDFANLAQSASEDNTHYAARLGITLPTLYEWTSNLALSEKNKWSGLTQQSQRLSLSRSLSRSWRVNLDLSHTKDENGSESGISVQFSWSPMERRTQAHFGYVSQDSESTMELSYLREGELGMELRAAMRDSTKGQQQGLSGRYISTKLDSHFTTFRNQVSGEDTRQTSTLGVGASLAFADGSFAISRPLLGQPFALLKGKASLEDSRLGIIRGVGNQPYAFLNGAGSRAVMPNLAPYYVNDINLNIKQLPIGVQLELQRFRLKPGYRSGVLLDVGVAGRVYLIATLLDIEGRPVSYKVGVIEPLDHPDREPLSFFTDDQGYFEAADIEPGRYRILIRGLSEYQGLFQVLEGSFGRLEFGVVQLELNDTNLLQ